MGKVIKKVAKVVNKIDPIGRQVDKQLNKAGLPTASDVGDMLGGAEPVESTAGAGTASAEEQRLKDEQEAAALANRATAERAKQRRAGSLLASGGNGGNAQTSSVLAYGKRTFGE
ncbi:hypothetical protein [Achromobacter sp. MFA1 R4]|uniref:hypothetical protein n=1 Tax=Achromobacter sp. MFA1 R4 TaxID=1881016 RepID=UPI0009538C57|nr:hypothetical protein [Achromobacter sp. MFA1 R4]SIT25356.1 hypothetical protein SAMN05428937_3009 [Achromobacter sp. MFA1 R4]